MKIIKLYETIDISGNKIKIPVEPLPENILYTTSDGDEMTCYSSGDNLPEEYNKTLNVFKFKRD